VADRVVSLKKPFFNACAGRFSVVEAAIKAGVPPQNVFASDIGLFSSIICYLADPSKKLKDLGIRILDPSLELKGINDPFHFAAHVMLILKLNQMKQTNLRGLYLREDRRHDGRPWVPAAGRWPGDDRLRRLHPGLPTI